MIRTFSDYIESYVQEDSLLGLPHRPGEHHFVATYLVPRLMKVTGVVPDFINPDGTKDIQGDIVYYRSGAHHFGIEVKFGVVRLTKREFNRWIWRTDSSKWPDVFVGVGVTGFAVAEWAEFRDAYVSAIQSRRGDWWRPGETSGYGPQVQVDLMAPFLPDATWFPRATSRARRIPVRLEEGKQHSARPYGVRFDLC